LFVAALVSCLLWISYSPDKRISADFVALISYTDYLLIDNLKYYTVSITANFLIVVHDFVATTTW